jgi:hypothetical protein
MDIRRTLPHDFKDLYGLTLQVSTLSKAGSLSFYLLERFQYLVQFYSSIVLSYAPPESTQKKSPFENMIKDINSLLQRELKSTPPAQILLSISRLTSSIQRIFLMTVEEVGKNADTNLYKIKQVLYSDCYTLLFYIMRLGVTYKRFFSDKLLNEANRIWRETSAILSIDIPTQLSFKKTPKVISSDQQGLFMDLLEHKFRSAETALLDKINTFSKLIDIVDPDSAQYTAKFAAEFSRRAMIVSIPLPMKEEENHAI